MATKTPDYTRRAINNYNSKFDRITVNFPKGTKERIKTTTGETAGGFAIKCVLVELDRLENRAAPGPVISAAPGPTDHKEKPTASEQPARDHQEEPLQDLRIRELGERIKENVRKLQEQDQEN